MARISTYEVVPVPKLADKLIGTSVGGEIEDITYNFTLLELLNLFVPNIPSSSLQGVLDNGNTATQDIILYGTIYTTNLEVTNTATLLDSYLNGDTNILGALYDVNGSKGLAAQVLSSTGTAVEWVTLPPIFTPTLQQVLTQGNTANLDIILTANIQALDINIDTATVNNNITIDGTITDGYSSVGTSNQVLSSTGTDIKWVNLPVYSATSPLFLDSLTGIFSIQQSSGTQSGYLSASDWITFNGKQNAGNYITALTGEATATGPGSVAITLSNPAVTGKVLTGLSITGGSISAADSILSAFGKVQGQLNALVGGVMFKGVWNAFTNTPTLTSSIGTQGWYYIVDVAGTTNLNGITDWQVGDWAIFNGSTWNKIDNTDLVTSVNGQVGAVSLTTDDISEGSLNLYFTDTRARNSVSATTPLAYNNISGVFSIQVATSSQDGYLTSTDWTTFNSKQNALSGTGIVKSTSGTITYITDNSSNWNTAYNDSIVSAAVTGTSTKTLTLNQQDGGTITASWSDADTGLTSVGLSMPVAFSVANTPLTANGTLAVTAVGTATQYIRGDGQLATFPSSGGGGSSVFYYLNGSIAASVATYKQMSNTAVIGAGTNFNLSGNGLIAQFLTDVGNPNRLEIPGGAWNFEMFFSMSSSGGTPQFYVELLKYDGVVFTSIASGAAVPETINGGTTTDLYLSSLAVPTTTLLLTDRLAVRVYIINNSGGRTATLHTEDSNLCQIITTFSAGISAINGLTSNNQYLAVGTAGTDFAINSLLETHTFNLPTASAVNRGALSSANWTTFNNKANALSGTTNTVPKFTSGTTIGDSNIKDNGNAVTINATAGANGALQVGNYGGNILMNTTSASGGLIFQNTSSSNKLWDFSSYNNDINFNESGIATPVMTLQAGGNVGIKQISPSYQLDVNGTFHNTGVVTLGNLAGSGSRMVITDSLGVLSTQAITTGTVTSVTASSPLASSGGNTPDISIPAATTSVNGYLTSTDWTTFNNKQNALTNPVTGTGGANFVPKFTSASIIANSQIYDNGTGVGVGITTLGAYFDVNGTGRFSGQLTLSSTLSNGTYTYTLPSATGTLALTSAIPTNAVGASGFWTSGFLAKINGTYTVTSSIIQDDGGSHVAIGYLTNPALYMLDVNGTGKFVGQLTLGSTITNGTYTYTLPSATGTLALTSALSGYLPLTGGTLTGALGGTSATFSGQLIFPSTSKMEGSVAPNFILASTSAVGSGNGPYQTFKTNSSDFGYIGSEDALMSTTGNKLALLALNGLSFRTGSSYIERLSIASTGAATFSSSLTVQSIGISVTIDDAGKQGYTIINSAASRTYKIIAGIDGTSNTGFSIRNVTAGRNELLFTDTGAATFSSSVKMGGGVASGTMLTVANGTNSRELQSGYSTGAGYNYLQVYDGTSFQPLNINNLLHINGSSNVGIGTSSPAAFTKLQIAGTAGSQVDANQQLFITAPTTTAGQGAGIRLSAASGAKEAVGIIGVVNEASGNLGAMTFHVYNAGANVPEYMRITSGGNVLIGTTTDAGYKLDVNGTGRFTSNLGIGISSFASWAGGTENVLQVKNSSIYEYGGYETALSVNAYYNAGWKYIGTNTATQLQLSNGALNFKSAVSGSAGGAITWTTPLTIASTGAATFSSSVTATQFNAVNDRNYLARGSFRLTSPTNNASALDISVTDSTTSIYSNYYGGGNDNTIIIGTYANLTNQLVLKPSGNVLIGTTTDNATGKLQINGSVTIGNFASAADATLNFATNASGGARSIIYRGATALLDFTNTAGTILFQLSNNGAATFSNLAGTGSRTVLADANGVLSAPVSDISIKENIQPLDYGIAAIMKLKPVSFEYIKSFKNYGEGKQIGNIAQDVAKVIPEAVFTTPSTGKMGINYDQLNGVYIKALQELQEQIKELQSQINK